MVSKQVVNVATFGKPGRAFLVHALRGGVALAASMPVVGFSQSLGTQEPMPAVVHAPSVGVAPQAPPAAPPAAAPAMPPPVSAPSVSPGLSPPLPPTVVAPTLTSARVLSVTSVAQPASATRLVCTDAAEVPAPTSGAGAMAGALVGAAVGSQLGGGAGTALATAAGFVGGALIGDKAEQGGRTQTVRQCVTHSGSGPRLAYQVLYEFGGQPYSTLLPYHPGATLQVQVSPVVAGVDAAPGTVAVAPPFPEPVAHTVVVAAPAYGYYSPYGYSAYAPYWGAPAVVGVGVGIGRHWGGRPHRVWHGHRRW